MQQVLQSFYWWPNIDQDIEALTVHLVKSLITKCLERNINLGRKRNIPLKEYTWISFILVGKYFSYI